MGPPAIRKDFCGVQNAGSKLGIVRIRKRRVSRWQAKSLELPADNAEGSRPRKSLWTRGSMALCGECEASHAKQSE